MDNLVTDTRADSDEDIMSKAQRLAAKRNLENSEFSFINFNPKLITSNLNNVGIYLYTNDCEVLNSIVSIKNIEVNRLTVYAISPSPNRSRILEVDEEDEIDAKLSHVTKSWDQNTKLIVLNLCHDLSVAPDQKTNLFKFRSEGFSPN